MENPLGWEREGYVVLLGVSGGFLHQIGVVVKGLGGLFCWKEKGGVVCIVWDCLFRWMDEV